MGIFNRKALTMIELMAVVVIISVMIAVVAPDVSTYLKETKERSSLDAVKIIRQAINDFVVDHSNQSLNPQSKAVSSISFNMDMNSDTYLRFPVCLHQLVKEKYLLNIPDNPFTGDADWEVRGFAEPSNLDSSWIKAFPKNAAGEYDSKIVPTGSNYTPYMPKISANANREEYYDIELDDTFDAKVTVGNVIGVYDVRMGDDEGKRPDLDIWDERPDGIWAYVERKIERIVFSQINSISDTVEVTEETPIDLFPNENFNIGNLKSNQLLVELMYTDGDIVTSDQFDIPAESEKTYWDLDPTINNLSFSGGTISGNPNDNDVVFTAGATPGNYKLSFDFETIDTGNGNKVLDQATGVLPVKIRRKMVAISADTTEINIITGQRIALNDIITVTIEYEGGSTEVASSSVIVWDDTVADGSKVLNNFYLQGAPTATTSGKLKASITDKKTMVAFYITPIQINVIRRFENLVLTPNTTTIKTGQTYDLDNITVQGEFSDGTYDTIISGVSWSILNNSEIAGVWQKGIIDTGNLYKAPDSKEVTVVVEASYYVADLNLIKTAYFTIIVEKSLTSIYIVPEAISLKNTHGPANGFVTEDLPVLLDNVISTYGRYSDNSIAKLLPSDTEWTYVSGPGTVNTADDEYTSLTYAESGTSVLQVQVIKDGITAVDLLTIELKPIVTGLSITPTTRIIKNLESFDFDTCTAEITWSDGYSEILGSDKIWALNYTAPVTNIGSFIPNVFFADTSEIGSEDIGVRFTWEQEFADDVTEIRVTRFLDRVKVFPEKFYIETGDTIDLKNSVQLDAFYSNSTFNQLDVNHDIEYDIKRTVKTNEDMTTSEVVLGSITGDIYQAPFDASGTTEIKFIFTENYTDEPTLSIDTAEASITVAIKGFIDALTVSPDSVEIYTFREETTEISYDSSGNEVDPYDPMITVDHTAEVWVNNNFDFDIESYINIGFTDGNAFNWGKNVDTAFIPNPEDLVFTITSGPGSIVNSPESGLPHTFKPPASASGTTEILVEYAYDGHAVSNTFTVVTARRPLEMKFKTPKTRTDIDTYEAFWNTFPGLNLNLDLIDVYINYSDGTQTKFNFSDFFVEYYPYPGCGGTFDGLTWEQDPSPEAWGLNYFAGPTPYKDTIDVYYTDGKTTLNGEFLLVALGEPLNLQITTAPPTDTRSVETGLDGGTYEVRYYYDTLEVMKVVTGDIINLWDEQNVLTVVLYTTDTNLDESAYVANKHPNLTWELVSGLGSFSDYIDGADTYVNKVFTVGSAVGSTILRSRYVEPEIPDSVATGGTTKEIELIVVAPVNLYFKRISDGAVISSESIETGDVWDFYSKYEVWLELSDGTHVQPPAANLSWNKTSTGNSLYVYDAPTLAFETDRMTGSAVATLTCTYTTTVNTLTSVFTLNINVVKPPTPANFARTSDFDGDLFMVDWDDTLITDHYRIYIDPINPLVATKEVTLAWPSTEILIMVPEIGETYNLYLYSVNDAGDCDPAATILNLAVPSFDPPSWVAEKSSDTTWNYFWIEYDRISRVDGYYCYLNGVLVGDDWPEIRDFHYLTDPGGSDPDVSEPPAPAGYLTDHPMLDPSTTYTVGVCGYKGSKKGTQGTITVTTDDLPSVWSLSIYNVKIEEFTVKWSFIDPDVTGFKINVKGSDGSDNLYVFPDPTTREVILDFPNHGIIPGTTYDIDVYSYYTGTYNGGVDILSPRVSDSVTTTSYNISINTVTPKYEGFNVTWGTVPETDSYEVWLDGSYLDSTYMDNYLISGLDPDTIHDIEVRAMTANGNILSTDSAMGEMTLYEDMIINLNAKDSTSFEIDWTAVVTASSYEVFVNDMSTAEVILSAGTEVFSMTGLDSNTIYDIKVICYSSTPKDIGSGTYEVTTDPLPKPNNLVEVPVTTADEKFGFKITWDDPLWGVESYEVWADTGSGFENISLTNILEANAVTNTEFETDIFGPGDVIDIIVYGINTESSGDKKSAPSDVLNINTTPIYPVTNLNTAYINYSTFEVQWTDNDNTPDLDLYVIQVDIDGVTVDSVEVTGGVYNYIGDSSLALAQGDTMEVRVYGVIENTTTNVKYYTSANTINFNMNIVPPITNLIVSGIGLTEFTVSWDDATLVATTPPGIDGYKVYIDGEYSNAAGGFDDDPDETDTTYTATGLTQKQTYNVVVYAYFGSVPDVGLSANISATPDIPFVTNLVVESKTVDEISISFNEEPLAADYLVEIIRTSDSSVIASIPEASVNPGSNDYHAMTISGLAFNTEYEIKVISRDGSAVEGNSASVIDTTDELFVSGVVIANTTPEGFEINWDENTLAADYTVLVTRVSDSIEVYNTTDVFGGGSPRVCDVTGLDFNVEYNIKITPNRGGNPGTTYVITPNPLTEDLVITNLVIAAKTYSELTVNWDENSFADDYELIITLASDSSEVYNSTDVFGGGNPREHIQSGLTPDTYYYIKVTPNRGGNPGTSLEIFDKTDPLPGPTGVVWTGTRDQSSIELTWNEDVPNATQYNIYFDENSSGTKTFVGSVAAGSLPFTANIEGAGFSKGSQGDIYVTADTSDGYTSDFSNVYYILLVPDDIISINKTYQGPFSYKWLMEWLAVTGGVDYNYELKNMDRNRSESGTTASLNVTLYNNKFYRDDSYRFRISVSNTFDGDTQSSREAEVWWNNNGAIGAISYNP